MSNSGHKALVFLGGEIKTPPLSPAARAETGHHLRQLQAGRSLRMPTSRPMPAIGRNVHELRVVDDDVTWRIVYRIAGTAIEIVEVFAKKTRRTPREVIERCQKRLRAADA